MSSLFPTNVHVGILYVT